MKPIESPSSHVELPRLGSRWEIFAIALALVSVAVGGFFAGYASAGGDAAAGHVQQGYPEGFDVFWEVWNYVDNEFYYDKPTEAERTYGAIRGLLSALGDDYTAFVQPSLAIVERENREGQFGGIGAYVGVNEAGQIVISYPFPGQPAAEAGLREGDVILSVDGQSLENMSLSEGTALIRGELGTSTHLEIYRPSENETFEIDVMRDQIEVPTVQAEMLDNGIAYLSLFSFNGVATLQIENALRPLLAENPRALIFDLRGNPGGLLDEAVTVSDLFLAQGLIATQRTSLTEDPRVFYADSGDLAEDIPLIVLIDGGSASASEIVAGAIEENERGTLIGTHTFGKGSVQLVHDLSDGSLLRITYGAWYTPDETPITDVGIIPDVEVEIPEDFAWEYDPWLDAALDYIDQNFPGSSTPANGGEE